MNVHELNQILGKVDIYLLDQVMKSRYAQDDLILDAGCGKGRNLIFLNRLGFNIEACDKDGETIKKLKARIPDITICQAELSNLPYESSHFNHIICNAVLHFADSENHFFSMMNELNRILKTGGTLFIRMTSMFGLNSFEDIGNGQYILPDESTRFLLNDDHVSFMKSHFNFLDPIKTVNVDNIRCMTTLMLEKK